MHGHFKATGASTFLWEHFTGRSPDTRVDPAVSSGDFSRVVDLKRKLSDQENITFLRSSSNRLTTTLFCMEVRKDASNIAGY